MCQNGGTLSAVRIRLPNYYFTKYVLVKARICTKYMYIVVCICEPRRRGKTYSTLWL